MMVTGVPAETLSMPIGDLSEASIRLNFGGGQLNVRPARPGILVSGTFEQGVVQKTVGPGMIELEPAEPHRAFAKGCSLHWDVGLTGEIPVDLRLETGANQSVVDLSGLRIRRLAVKTGASDTTIKLPTTGQIDVTVECGFAQVTIDVPDGVAARVHGRISLGATVVDDKRFPKSPEGWASPDFQTAPCRVDISVSGGFGTVRIS
jgi:hypothetical protein